MDVLGVYELYAAALSKLSSLQLVRRTPGAQLGLVTGFMRVRLAF